MRSIEQHLTNLGRKKLLGSSVVENRRLIEQVLEIISYDRSRPVSGCLSQACSMGPFNDDRPATAFYTRFSLYREFRAERSDAAGGFDPVVSREILEKEKKYAALWGMDWFVIKKFGDISLDEKDIIVTSQIPEPGDKVHTVAKPDLRFYRFRIQDDETLQFVESEEIAEIHVE